VVASAGVARSGPAGVADVESQVLEYIARRPATVADLSASLGLEIGLLTGLLARLTASGRARSISQESGIWYHAGVDQADPRRD
jgi:DNA-binding MarR family transcriptional regulator